MERGEITRPLKEAKDRAAYLARSRAGASEMTELTRIVLCILLTLFEGAVVAVITIIFWQF